jgi:hypothetical protein
MWVIIIIPIISCSNSEIEFENSLEDANGVMCPFVIAVANSREKKNHPCIRFLSLLLCEITLQITPLLSFLGEPRPRKLGQGMTLMVASAEDKYEIICQSGEGLEEDHYKYYGAE